jgi:EpsI family protein
MPGAGWQTQSLQLIQLSVPERREPLRINRYVVGMGNERAVLLYWYQSNERAIATEYLAKIYLVMDSIRYRRSNTSLVRVVLPVTEGAAEAPPAEAGAALIRASYGSIQRLLTP